MKPPSIGELTERVAIKRISRGTADGQGGYGADTEDTLMTVWAKVYVVGSTVQEKAGSQREARTHDVTIRYTTTPLINDKVTWGSTDLRVVGLVPLGKRWLVMECAPWVVAM
jgi:SPP1 family predicted phage head-tail adaptor